MQILFKKDDDNSQKLAAPPYPEPPYLYGPAPEEA